MLVFLYNRQICSLEQDYLEKSKEYIAYLVAWCHSPKKVKQTFENVGKITRTEATVKKQRTASKNTNVFPAEYSTRRPNVNATIKKHKQNNTILEELFPSNSIIVANKSGNNLHYLIAQTDPYKIKRDLLDQTPHGYKRCGRKCDSCDNFILEEKSFMLCHRNTKFRILRDSTCNTKNVIY